MNLDIQILKDMAAQILHLIKYHYQTQQVTLLAQQLQQAHLLQKWVQ